MLKRVSFENACKKLKPKYFGKKYRLKGKNTMPSHWLKLHYQNIAKRYFYYETYNQTIVFPGEIVQEIAKELGVYVTDIIRYRK